MLKSRGLGAQGGGVRGTDVFTCLHDTKDSWSHSLLNVHFLRAKGFVSCSPRTQPGTSLELSEYLPNE